jgi:hydroxymethylpyrimidine/phosphomethylpyrimidine kinase
MHRVFAYGSAALTLSYCSHMMLYLELRVWVMTMKDTMIVGVAGRMLGLQTHCHGSGCPLSAFPAPECAEHQNAKHLRHNAKPSVDFALCC